MSHAFLVKGLERLKATIDRKIARLGEMGRLKSARKSTKEKIEKKRVELEESLEALERLIDRLKLMQ